MVILPMVNKRSLTFLVATSVHGRQLRMTLGRWPLLGGEDARALAMAVLRDCRSGQVPERRIKPSLATVREAILASRLAPNWRNLLASLSISSPQANVICRSLEIPMLAFSTAGNEMAKVRSFSPGGRMKLLTRSIFVRDRSHGMTSFFLRIKGTCSPCGDSTRFGAVVTNAAVRAIPLAWGGFGPKIPPSRRTPPSFRDMV